ncbi:MAG TPA: hypothetical protein DCE44_05665, partial [Verrucomicrobiales bacterium]|nr:hypothetical protein [Verrucomicrobiales bacterium]
MNHSNGRDGALRRPRPAHSSGLALRSDAQHSPIALLRKDALVRGAAAARQPHPVLGLESRPDSGGPFDRKSVEEGTRVDYVGRRH